MAKYSKKASKTVESAMRRRKKGTLKSGRGGKGGTVKSRKQAIAIGLSEAREKGAKVPPKKKAGRKRATKKSASKKSAARKTASRKSAPRKKAASKKTARKSKSSSKSKSRGRRRSSS